MKATAKTKLAMAEEACPAADPVFQKFAALPDTLDEIDALLAQETAKAALNLDTDESVVLEFDQRRRVIEERREVYDANRKKLAATTRELETIRGDWEPTLDSLTEKISERFAIYFERREGCA